MTKIFAMISVRPLTAEQVERLMLEEVQVVMQQYVDGKIEQFWRRKDGKGAMLLLDTADLAEAGAWMDALPLTR